MKPLLVSFYVLVCAYAVPLERVAHGQNAARNQFPYQINIKVPLQGIINAGCSGSILSPTWILTAGSCNTSLDVTVVAGILDRLEDGVERNFSGFLVHPNFTGGIAPHDIALIKLDEPLTFSESIQPIALPEPGTIPQGQAVLSGWGNSETFILQYAYVPIISYDECASALIDLIGTSDNLYERAICTGPLAQGVSACAGDGGAPLVQEGVVVGVASWGIVPCGYPGAPTVYTRVSDYLDFILEHVDDLP